MKTHHALLLDTETIGLEKPFVYDLSFIVIRYDEKEKIYKEVSKHAFVIKQIYNNKPLFNTAYYANKRPIYTSKLRGKKAKQKHFGHTLRLIKSIMKQYDIKRVYAYNSDFDRGAIAFTSKFFGTQNPFDKITFYDLQGIANKYIHTVKRYQEYCKENNLLTPKRFYKGTAETTYQYIMGKPDFVESHVGIEDCEIELRILNNSLYRGYDFKYHKKRLIKAV